MTFRAIFFALLLAACGQGGQTQAPGEPEQSDAFALHIEIGRYGVMLSHVEELTAEQQNAAEPQAEDPAELARGLRETVWEYNLMRSQLCARGLYMAVTCGPIYAPVWLADTAAPSLEELESRSAAVGEEVMRLWGAVCEDARTREPDEQLRMYVCAIE